MVSKRIFISYAANDQVWTEAQVRSIALWLKAQGLTPLLDVLHVEAIGQKLAPADWRGWMDQSLREAAHVVCLCSPRYQTAWSRNESVSGGCGVAFESSRIERWLYDRKQNNAGHVATLSISDGQASVPSALRDACPDYVWGKAEDDRLLARHLTGPALVPAEANLALAEAAAPKTSPVTDCFSHQAAAVEDHMRAAPHLWSALASSAALRRYLDGLDVQSPGDLVRGLRRSDAEQIQKAMYEIRSTLQDVQKDFPSPEQARAASKATITLYMLCACLLVRAGAPALICGLPQLDSEPATHLLATIIGLSLAGGRLELVTDVGASLPRGKNTRTLLLVSDRPEASFERELYNVLVLNGRAVESSLKTGLLSDEERKALVHRITSLRGLDERTQAFAVVVNGDRCLDAEKLEIAAQFSLPIFTFRNDPTFEFLAGVSAGDIVALVGELWQIVRDDLQAESSVTEPMRASASQENLDRLVEEIRALTLLLKDHPASKSLQSRADELQAAAKESKQPERNVLRQTKDTLEGLEAVGEAGEKLLPRLMQLLNLFM